MKLTLDTNCIINHFDPTSLTATSKDEIAALIRYATSGRVQIVITTRAEADIEQDKNEERRGFIKSTLATFESVPSLLRWDESRWGDGDVWTDPRTKTLADEIQRTLFPGLVDTDKRFGNKIRDVDHLVAHALDHRDVFVTDDGRLNEKSADLTKLGIVVMRPAQCVEYIQAADAPKIPLEPTSPQSDGHRHTGHSGFVTFDYSNNNGRYLIGDGYFLFETMWSKASDTCIYALCDAKSIDSLALAKGVADISAILDASSFDYSSRARQPGLGEIVLWRNVNGLYAATRVISIADDKRGSANDELTFEFRVLTNGVNFSVAGW